jgi:hypothetical protein
MKNIKYYNPIIENIAKSKINNEYECVEKVMQGACHKMPRLRRIIMQSFQKLNTDIMVALTV